MTGACDYATLGLDALALIPGGAALKFANTAAKDAAEITALKAIEKVDKALESNKGFQEILAKLTGITSAELSGAGAVVGVVQSNVCGP